MKRFAKTLSVLFAAILAVSAFAFAEEVEDGKTYIVYPKETVSLFSAEGETPRYMVIGEEELNMLLEEAPEMIDWYEENSGGWFVYDEIYTDQYKKEDLDAIKARGAWDKGYKGGKVRVAVIDSGVDTTHPELKNCVVDQWDYIDNDNVADDQLTHGTGVVGVIAAPHDKFGIKGIAPEVEIVALKVGNNDSDIEAETIARAINDAVGKYECKVINISLAISDYNQTLKNAIDNAVKAEVVVVAAVGNYEVKEKGEVDESGSVLDNTTFIVDNTPLYPAAYENVIGVGAVDWLDYSISHFSKVNDSVFITAPGEYIVTTDPGYKTDKGTFIYVETYGTSLAAPLVTGAVALIRQANPELTPEEIMDILAESARDDSKGDGYDTAYGHGVLNVAAAIELALGHEMLAPENITYTVSAENSELNGAVTVDNYIPGNIGSHPLGASFTAKAKPTVTIGNDTYKFAYWANGNGTYVSGETPYTFIATSNFTLRAVYDKVVVDESATTEKKVEFWNGNGVLLGTKKANNEGKVNSDDIPVADAKMTGYAFDRWIDEDEKEFTAESVLEKNFTRVVAQFEDAATEYSITFDDATDTDTKETGAYGEKVTYTATGDSFDYWTLDGEIVSYDPTIKIALWGADKKLTAVYDKTDIVKKPTVVLDTGADEANFLIYSVPTGYTIVDAGIVFGTEGSTPRVASFHSKASVKNIPESGFGQFTSLPGGANHTKARGYLIYKDPDNVTRVIYAD